MRLILLGPPGAGLSTRQTAREIVDRLGQGAIGSNAVARVDGASVAEATYAAMIMDRAAPP